MTIVTRFAPSPTGMLHIGSVRTAYYNWLHAQKHNGRMLLRIEDTDRQRSTQQAIDAILEGLQWLKLDHDGDVIYQSQRIERHQAVAQELLKENKAYYCYATAEELVTMRREAQKKGGTKLYNGLWRDKDPKTAPNNVKPVIRLKAEQTGETMINDTIQGEVIVGNDTLDDMVLLRSDGTPTYMLAVVVDDHDMGVTDIIRGDDHLTNSFRQLQIYRAMDWQTPLMAHMPLLHGVDGGKLSKRHGALSLQEWQRMGYDGDALLNYLLRLGWSHGNDEIIPRDQALQWFDIRTVGRSAARFDKNKLNHINAHYLRMEQDDLLAQKLLLFEPLSSMIGDDERASALSLLARIMADIKPRGQTLPEMAYAAAPYFKKRPIEFDNQAKKYLANCSAEDALDILQSLQSLSSWHKDDIERILRQRASEQGESLKKTAQWVRLALVGCLVSPPLFTMMEFIGKEETMLRLQDMVKKLAS